MNARAAGAGPRTRARRRRDRAAAPGAAAFLAANGGFLVGAIIVGSLQWWTIYRAGWFAVTVSIALVAGAGIALLGARRHWSPLVLAAVTVAAYLVLGFPAGAPTMITDPATLVPAFIGVVTAPITGWKNLLTLELPLGDYQATLAPLFFGLLVVAVVSLSLAWRSERWWGLAAPLTLLVPIGGIVFGSSALAGASRGGRAFPGALELFVGIVTVLVLTTWLLWRVRHARRAALDRARRESGVRVTARSRRTLAGRIGLGTAMLVVALAAGLVIAPWAVAGAPRDVLRTGVDPRLLLRQTLSPLTDYRAYFSDDEYDTVQFTVATTGDVDRVRVATLGFYDGQVARATDPALGDMSAATAFVRVPQTVPGSAGATTTADIAIGAYTGVWVPQIGSLQAIRFDGTTRAALSDGFYYAPSSVTGVELASPGLRPGIRYGISAHVDRPTTPLAELQPDRTGPAMADSVVPASLVTWMQSQQAPAGGAGLATLIERLRARGYLSHALTAPEQKQPLWLADLDGKPFESSRAGHSTDRIGDLFRLLNETQDKVGANAAPELLVAAPGDDEQFAVAAAMIADRLGFPARVVLGARLTSTDPTLPTCRAGACTGRDMSAWIEVQDHSGAWTAIDTSPQHALPLAPDVQDRRDPQNPTDVPPDHAETIQPPEPDPADAGAPEPQKREGGIDWALVGTIARITGISLGVLVVLFGPFLAVVIAKALRRRSRRSSDDVVDRFVGGWDEYVDAAVDAGRQTPRSATRTELARAIDPETARGLALAEWTDRSVFAQERPDDTDGDAFWRLVDQERLALLGGASRWQRLRARLSLRSFARGTLLSRPRSRTWRAWWGRRDRTGGAPRDDSRHDADATGR